MESVFINGWTKETVIKHITDNFKGKAMIGGGPLGKTCVYLTSTGRKCAVGLFIPDGHEAQQYSGTSVLMIEAHPDLADKMPLSKRALYDFQTRHDGMDEDLSINVQTDILVNYIKGLN